MTSTASSRTGSPAPAAPVGPRPEALAGGPPLQDQSPLEVELESWVRALLVRISASERLATAAHQDEERVFSWPSWSMDTGLTEAQERFVEAWSPRLVLESCRAQRRLIHELQSRAHLRGDDAGLDEALTLLSMLPDW